VAGGHPDLEAADRLGPTDRGATWQDATRPEGLPGNSGGTVAITADASAIVWSPANTTVTPFHSSDLGKTWNSVQGLPAGARTRSDRVQPASVYAYSGGKFYRSTDGGKTFADTGATGLPNDGVDDFRVAPGKQGHIWLGGRSEKAGVATGLWHSKDGGITWTRITGVDLAIGVGFGKAARGAGYPAIYLAGAIAGQDGFFRSIDRGTSWYRINDDNHQWAFAGSAITGDPEVYGRVYLSARGIIYGDIAG
jgi:photosystem II stability/assembly factor-like uncharacterized protein